VRHDYRFRVPAPGFWREVLNSDSAIYGGSNVGNAGLVQALDAGDRYELSLVLPPLAAVFLVPQE